MSEVNKGEVRLMSIRGRGNAQCGEATPVTQSPTIEDNGDEHRTEQPREEPRLISHDIHEDERGEFSELGVLDKVAQINTSYSNAGTWRGFHYQWPKPQKKLVTCVSGMIMDFVVDIDPVSPTYLQHKVFILSSDDNGSVYVPETYAHGFFALEDSVVVYQCSDIWRPEYERGLNVFDPSLSIRIPRDEIVAISKKDLNWGFIHQQKGE